MGGWGPWAGLVRVPGPASGDPLRSVDRQHTPTARAAYSPHSICRAWVCLLLRGKRNLDKSPRKKPPVAQGAYFRPSPGHLRSICHLRTRFWCQFRGKRGRSRPEVGQSKSTPVGPARKRAAHVIICPPTCPPRSLHPSHDQGQPADRASSSQRSVRRRAAAEIHSVSTHGSCGLGVKSYALLRTYRAVLVRPRPWE